MSFNIILVRYGEIGLKSRQTRRAFEEKLMDNIKTLLKKHRTDFKNITCEWGRVYIETADEKILPLLKTIFGIASFSPASSCKSNMADISKLSTKLAKKRITKEDSFAVRASRQGEHDFRSRDVGVHVGAKIQEEIGASVDLDKPIKEVFVEVRDKRAFVFSGKTKGPGGLPQGIEGKAVGVFEKGNPYQAAAYLMSKRGCDIEAICTEKLDLEQLRYWLGDFKVHKVTTDPYKEAEKLAKKIDAKALFNADVLLKDKPHVIPDFAKQNKKVSLPIFRPLIGLDNDQIKKLTQL
jgi:thiamine biosynthesis protein ThiI